MNLVSAKTNVNLRVSKIKVDTKSEVRLKSLGIIIGSSIIVLCITGAGVVLALGQNVIALSKGIACKIMVEYD